MGYMAWIRTRLHELYCQQCCDVLRHTQSAVQRLTCFQIQTQIRYPILTTVMIIPSDVRFRKISGFHSKLQGTCCCPPRWPDYPKTTTTWIMATCLFVLGDNSHLYHLFRVVSDSVSQRGHCQEHLVLLDQFAPLLKVLLFCPLQHYPDSSVAFSFNIDSILKSSIKHENNQRLCESARCLLLV